MPRFKDQAVCIRDFDWSESSQVVVLLTESHGKIRGIAKGSRRQSPSSIARFSGGIDLLTAGQVVATTRPSSELASITEWDLQENHFALRKNFRGQQIAMLAADLCHAFLADLDAHPAAFAVLTDFLGALGGDPGGLDRALLRFQWGLLVDCGYKPELERDVRRSGELEAVPAYSFDPVAGGLTADKGLTDWRVRAETVKLLRRIEAGEAAEAEADTVGRANKLLCVYARAILDKELPTMSLLLE